jgi:FkbM family methyltransferase
MPYLPVLILIVFGMVSIAFMLQMPEEKEYNIQRLIRGEPEVESEPVVEPEHEPVVSLHTVMPDRCNNIYVDLGSNIGVQIRKLFEPFKYPKSKILGKFNEILGSVDARRKNACAFGFEANPKHFKRLIKLQDIYNTLGWKTNFFNKVVWTEDGRTMTIYSDDENRNEDWGSGVLDTAIPDKNRMSEFKVPTIDIALWLQSIIKEYRPSAVMLKMDIEGSEYNVLPHLLEMGLFCSQKISYMYLEFHKWATVNGQKLNMNTFRQSLSSQTCSPTIIVDIDDETYLHDGVPLPTPVVKSNVLSDPKNVEFNVSDELEEPVEKNNYNEYKEYMVVILSTDRRQTFGIKNRKRGKVNFFPETYSTVSNTYSDVRVLTDDKTNLYQNIENIEIYRPPKTLEVHSYAKEMYTHAVSMNEGKAVLIFEDDIDIVDDFKTTLEKSIDILNAKNIEKYIIECYNHNSKNKQHIGGNLYEVKYEYGTQCMYYSKDAVKIITHALKQSKKNYDHAISDAGVPVYNLNKVSLVQHMGNSQTTGLAGLKHSSPYFKKTRAVEP